MKTAVVILNWNGRPMLERFLPSVIEHTTHEAEVIVADNGSTDDSIEFMRSHYPTVRLILLDRNYGFADGYNRAFEQIEADYYVLLNDDVEVTPHWCDRVVEMMEKDEKIAVAQPKLLMFDQKDTFEYAGGAGGFIDKYGYPFCRGRVFSTIEKDKGQYDDSCEIFWATGAALFVRASVWKELGGLDGSFFAHMEEIDFCWRCKNRGYKAVYCPESVVYHVGGGTLPKSSPFKTQLNFRNNLAMLYKNLPDRRLRRVLSLRFVLDWVAAFSFLLKGNVGEFKAVFAAHKEFRSWKPMLKKKRAEVNPHEVPHIMKRSLLLQYHLMRHRTFLELRDKF
ncbi:MAG: glycosyltransferase family 2 protein [Bacteroidales bacterium]|nr:glycosyltransferase family 2 protein [Bacteroidales bacterium]MCR5192826.1 glycosyltransferase family 2 protein [Bacteroidales bacterium]